MIADNLMVWGANFDTGLRCMSNALSRAIFRGNFRVAFVLCEHGALSNVPGVYLEGFTIQFQYRTPDILTVRIADQPSQLEATPMALMESLRDGFNCRPSDVLSKCADWNTTATPDIVDYMAKLTEWVPRIAIDNFAVSFSRSHRTILSAVMTTGLYTGDVVHMHRKDRRREKYVWDQATACAQYESSITTHVLTVYFLPTQDIERSLTMLMKYKAAYHRLPKLNITPFNLGLSVSLDLTKQLLDMGYTEYEHCYPGYMTGDSFSLTQTIPTLRDETKKLLSTNGSQGIEQGTVETLTMSGRITGFERRHEHDAVGVQSTGECGRLELANGCAESSLMCGIMVQTS